jgi:hypothetical protein
MNVLRVLRNFVRAYVLPWKPLRRKFDLGPTFQQELSHLSRPFKAEELAILRSVIELGPATAQTYAAQLSYLTAQDSCACGCPSFSLNAGPNVAPGHSSSRVVAEMRGRTREGKQVGLILFQSAGLLSELEVFSMDDIDGNFGLPVLESLHDWASKEEDVQVSPIPAVTAANSENPVAGTLLATHPAENKTSRTGLFSSAVSSKSPSPLA